MALKYKVIRCVAYTIEIILLFILQELPYLMPSLLGVRPLLLIAAPMTIAILENEKIDDKCIVCGKPAKDLVVWGIQY